MRSNYWFDYEAEGSSTRSSGLLKVGIKDTCMHALEVNQVHLQFRVLT